MSDKKPPKAELVGDLETLRTLLDEDDEPTLDLFADDQLDQGVEPIAEPVAGDNNRTTIAAPSPELPQPLMQTGDLFESLLGERWQQQSAKLLATASSRIQAQKLDWNPDDTEALTQALKTRLEQTLNNWLQSLLADNVEQLQESLLAAMNAELTTRVQDTLQTNEAQRQQKEAGLAQLAQSDNTVPNQ